VEVRLLDARAKSLRQILNPELALDSPQALKCDMTTSAPAVWRARAVRTLGVYGGAPQADDLAAPAAIQRRRFIAEQRMKILPKG